MATLTNIDGRKLSIQYADGKGHVVYLRKGIDSAQYLPLLMAEVELTTVHEKGYEMVQELKPVLPKTEAEKTGPVDMAPSANVPRLDFQAGQEGFAPVTAAPDASGKLKDTRSQKDHDIMRQWAMGHTLLSPALAQCNDAMALNTEQTIARAKWVAAQLLDWVKER